MSGIAYLQGNPSFVGGALNAAIWISKKNKGLFNMQDMFGLK